MNHSEISRRPDRIAELIQRKLAHLIQNEIQDVQLPRWLTILEVKLSKDLSQARVYFTALSETPDDVAVQLNASAPFLRSALARTLSLRKVPRLIFVHDASVEYGKQLNRLIDRVNGEDVVD